MAEEVLRVVERQRWRLTVDVRRQRVLIRERLIGGLAILRLINRVASVPVHTLYHSVAGHEEKGSKLWLHKLKR